MHLWCKESEAKITTFFCRRQSYLRFRRRPFYPKGVILASLSYGLPYPFAFGDHPFAFGDAPYLRYKVRRRRRRGDRRRRRGIGKRKRLIFDFQRIRRGIDKLYGIFD